SFPLPQECWHGNEAFVYTAAARTFSLSVVGTLNPKALAVPQGVEPGADTPLGRVALRQKLLPPGNLILQQRLMSKTDIVRWEHDGQPLDGWLTVPPDAVAKPPYKLIVFPHGGPHSRASFGFNFTVQVLAANGFAVFQPNFRGSEGYGQKFID